MAKTTKDLIFRNFIEILKEKPFDKITVRDIVERASINRHTFYYYYSDIYEMLEELFKMEFTEIVSRNNSGFRWLVGFSKMVETCYANKKIINTICASKSYDYLENYLFKSCRAITSEYIMSLAEGKNVDRDTMEFIISYHQYAIIGMLSEWFRTGMPEEPQVMIRRFLYTFSGVVSAIESARKK